TSPAASACAGSWTSERTGTPVASLIPFRIRSPSLRPGPRNEAAELRFALSKDALKTKGTEDFRHISERARAIFRQWASLSMTHGPATKARGAPPPIARSWPTRTLRTAGRPPSAPGRAGPFAGIDEAPEQRVRLHRLRFEFRVELAGEEVRVVRYLHDLHEAPVGRLARHTQATTCHLVE